MKRLLMIFPLIILLGSCASQMYYNKARNSYRGGDTVTASEFVIQSLRENPENQKSIALVEEIFPRAIEKLERTIEQAAAGTGQFRWSAIADAYGKIHSLNNRITSLPRLYLKKEKREVVFSVQYYDAEYAEAKPKAADENYREGLRLSQSKNKEDLRKAVSYFQKALSYIPGYEDAEARIIDTGKSATDILVVLMEQYSGKDGTGGTMSEQYDRTQLYIEDALISALLQGAKEKSFLKVIDTDFRDEAVEGQKNILSGTYDESNFGEIGQLFEADKILTLTLYPFELSDPEISERIEKREIESVLPETDQDYELYPDHTAIYSGELTYYSGTTTVNMTVSYRLINAATTEILDSDTFTREFTDTAEWFILEGDLEVLSEDEAIFYEESRRKVKTPEQLIEEGKDELVDLISGAVLLQFD